MLYATYLLAGRPRAFFAAKFVPLFTQTGERGPRGMRQPSSGGNQLIEAGPFVSAQQFDEQRLLGTWERRFVIDHGRLANPMVRVALFCGGAFRLTQQAEPPSRPLPATPPDPRRL